MKFNLHLQKFYIPPLEKIISKKVSEQFFAQDFWQLTKARLSISVVFSSVAGYILGASNVLISELTLLFIGGYCLVGSSNIFNQIIEKNEDALMTRTQNRPIPAGRMSIHVAFALGLFLLFVGVGLLWLINNKTVLFGFFSVVLYVFAYTPLKKITPWAVFVGAFPGAIPFMLGWVAATNQFGIESSVLFLIQFIWQFPHFWAIGWLLFNDYKKAGYNLLPSKNRDTSSALQMVIYTLSLVPITLFPFFGSTGALSLSAIGAIMVLLLGALFVFFSICVLKHQNKKSAKQFLFVGLFYLPVLQMIFMIDKFIA